MNLIRKNQSWLPNVFSDLFSNDWMLRANATAPAINIIESENDYKIEVAALCMTKDDILCTY
jgi:HSP20 family protein